MSEKTERLNREFGLGSDFGTKVPYDRGYGVVLTEIDLGPVTGKLRVRAGEPGTESATEAFENAGIIAKNDIGGYKLVAQVE